MYNKATPFAVAISFDVVTPESAEDGDTAATGWEVDAEELTLGDTLATLRRYGPYCHVQATYDGAHFVESDGSNDYRSGAVTTRTVHVSANRRAIARLVRCLEHRAAVTLYPSTDRRWAWATA